MKFREFKPGMVIRHGPITVDQDEMIGFASRYDPQWFHIDPAKAKAGRWNGLIGSGWLTCGLAMRMTVAAALNDSEVFGSPGVERLRWMLPVHPGDVLRLENTVDSARVSSSRPDLGILLWTWRLFNQNDEQVLEMEVTNLFDLGEPALQ